MNLPFRDRIDRRAIHSSSVCSSRERTRARSLSQQSSRWLCFDRHTRKHSSRFLFRSGYIFNGLPTWDVSTHDAMQENVNLIPCSRLSYAFCLERVGVARNIRFATKFSKSSFFLAKASLARRSERSGRLWREIDFGSDLSDCVRRGRRRVVSRRVVPLLALEVMQKAWHSFRRLAAAGQLPRK